MKNNLLIIISTENKDSILKFPLLYGGVSIPRDYWKRVCIMFWGASILSVKHDMEIRQKILSIKEEGVEFSACIVCANEYDAVESLSEIGIVSNHTGELLTKALKDDKLWAVLTV